MNRFLSWTLSAFVASSIAMSGVQASFADDEMIPSATALHKLELYAIDVERRQIKMDGWYGAKTSRQTLLNAFSKIKAGDEVKAKYTESWAEQGLAQPWAKASQQVYEPQKRYLAQVRARFANKTEIPAADMAELDKRMVSWKTQEHDIETLLAKTVFLFAQKGQKLGTAIYYENEYDNTKTDMTHRQFSEYQIEKALKPIEERRNQFQQEASQFDQEWQSIRTTLSQKSSGIGY